MSIVDAGLARWPIVAVLGVACAGEPLVGSVGGAERGRSESVAFMVRIDGGSFVLGTDDGPDDEQPAHVVDLSAFEIDALPVTTAQFAVFLAGLTPMASMTGARTRTPQGSASPGGAATTPLPRTSARATGAAVSPEGRGPATTTSASAALGTDDPPQDMG